MDPHVLPIYRTVGNNFLFKQDNAPIPAMWHGTVCKLVIAYPLTSLPDPDPTEHPVIFGIGGGGVYDLYPFPAAILPELDRQVIVQQ